MKKVAVNYIYNLAYKLVLIIAPLITTPYLARRLGADPLGEYSYVYTLVSMLLLVGGLGTGLYAQRGIAQRRNDSQEKSRFFFEILLFRFIGIALCIILYAVIIFFSRNKILHLIVGIELIAYLFDISWLYQGDEDFGKVLLRNIVLKTVTVVLIFVLIKTPNDLNKYAMLRGVSTFVSNVAIWPFVSSHISFSNIGKLKIKIHFAPVIQLFIPQILTQLYSNSDKLMLQWIGKSNAENGYYDQTYKIIEMCLILGQALNATLLPRLSHFYANKKYDDYKYLLLKSTRICMLLSFPMFTGLLLIADEFSLCFFGSGYEKVGLLLKLYSPFLLAMFSGLMCQQYLIATGKEKRYMRITLFVAIFNISINLFLIRYFLSVGAVISTILSEAILFLMVMRILISDKFIRLSDLWSIAKSYVGASVLMGGLLIVLNQVLPKGTIFLCMRIVFSALVYFIFLIVIREKSEGISEMRDFFEIREKFNTSHNRLIRIILEKEYRRLMVRYGADIPLNVNIPRTTTFPHQYYGIFISGWSKIGENCTIFQQVTIGSNTLKNSSKVGAPVIGNNVYIGAGAKIIGGVHIGDNVRVGANCVVAKDIPSNTTVVPEHPRLIKKDNSHNEFVSIDVIKREDL